MRLRIQSTIEHPGQRPVKSEQLVTGDWIDKRHSTYIRYTDGDEKVLLRHSKTDTLITRTGTNQMKMPFERTRRRTFLYTTQGLQVELATELLRTECHEQPRSFQLHYRLWQQQQLMGTYHLVITEEE